jgi:hypothetical protein
MDIFLPSPQSPRFVQPDQKDAQEPMWGRSTSPRTVRTDKSFRGLILSPPQEPPLT